MNFKQLSVIFIIILLVLGCKSKKKNYVYDLTYPDIKSADKPSEVGLVEDDYVRVEFSPAGNVLLYIVSRETKEGWGFGHGNELISYNLEQNLKLPLGKMGRSSMVKVVQLGEELKNAVVKTVDTDGNGDIDNRDCNQLYITTTFGLEDEPVSPIAKDTLGVWQDPLFEWVVFAVSSDWPGRVKKKKEGKIDPTPVVMAWNPETKLSAELATCDRFYGFSPDGLQYGCLVPGKDVAGETREVAVYQRGSKKVLKKIGLPVSKDDQVVLLGNDRYVYSKFERGESGEKTTLWFRDGGGKEERVTNPSVDSRILWVLGDGSVLFTSESVDSVEDFIAVRALSPDGAEVKTIFKKPGGRIDSLTVSTDGENLAFLERKAVKEQAEGEVVPAKIFIAGLAGKPAPVPVKQVAGEYIAGLGASILKNVKEKTGKFAYVDHDKISVDIRRKLVFIQIKLEPPEGESSLDEVLLSKAVEIKKEVVSVLLEEKYDGIVFSPDLKDGAVFLKWVKDWGGYFTYFSAYGEMVPLRDEYDLIIEDLKFMKMPGCRDPRLVQLHCSGWAAAVGEVKGSSFAANCITVPLNPIQFTRKETETMEALPAEGEAAPFDVVVDKVDPRRSHRYSYILNILVDGKPYPYYDSLWAEASSKWIELMRNLKEELPAPVIPYSGRTEFVQALAKWRPDSVVSRETHLDVHIFFQTSEKLPPIENLEAWEALAQSLLDKVTGHAAAYDEGREKDARVTLYIGNDVIFEHWHKTEEELLEEAMQDPNWTPPPIKPEKGKKKKKKKGKGDLLEVPLTPEEEALKSHVPPERLGLPKAMLDKKEIQKVVSAHISEVKFCYEKASASGDVGSGQITVKFVVSSKGNVESATVASASLKNSAVQSCVLKAVKRW